MHLSEQPAENADCLAATGLTPTRCWRRPGRSARATAVVHATHLTDADIATLGRRRRSVVICPTTEADLADGSARPPRARRAGAPLALGGDQHVVVDPFAQARGLEYGERLRRRAARRVRAGGPGGRAACERRTPRSGSPAGVLDGGRAGRPGGGPDRHRAHGGRGARTSWSWRAGAADVAGRGGRRTVQARSGKHVRYGDPGPLLAAAIEQPGGADPAAARGRPHARAVDACCTGISRAGDATTRRAAPGLLGSADDAAVVLRGRADRLGRPGGVGAAGRRGGRPRRPRGAARLGRLAHPPGVRRRPGGGVLGPDGRAPYARRRHAGDRRGHPRGHRPGVAGGRPPAPSGDDRGGHHLLETKTGYGLTVARRARGWPRAAAAAGFDEITFLGAHVVPPEFADDPDGYLDLVCGPMLRRRGAARRLDRRVLRDGRFRRGADPRGCCAAGRGSGLGPAGARQPARRRARGAARGRVPAPRRVDHCTHLTDRPTSTRCRPSRHGRHAAARLRPVHPAAARARPRAARRRAPGSRWRPTAIPARPTRRR